LHDHKLVNKNNIRHRTSNSDLAEAVMVLSSLLMFPLHNCQETNPLNPMLKHMRFSRIVTAWLLKKLGKNSCKIHGRGRPQLTRPWGLNAFEYVTQKLTRSSADAEGPHDVTQKYKILHLKRLALEKTFKDTKGHYNCCYQTGHIQESLPVSGLLLKHLYRAPFPRYYFSSVQECLWP